MATSAQHSMVLTKHLNKFFLGRFNTVPSQLVDHYSVGKTDEEYEVGSGISGFGAIPETREGMRPEYDEALNTFPYVHNVLDYRKGFRVTDKLYKSDKYKVFGPKMAQELARSAKYTIEILAARPFNLGFTTFLSPDGVPIFSSNHPRIDGGAAQGNRPSTNAALSVSALQAGMLSVRSQRDDRGKLHMFRAKDIVIPPALEWSARTILSSTLLPGGANNDANVLSGALDPFVWDFLTSPTAWFLRDPIVKTDEGGVIVMKKKVDVTTSSNYDWDTRSTKYDVEFSLLIGATDWRGYYATPGA